MKHNYFNLKNLYLNGKIENKMRYK